MIESQPVGPACKLFVAELRLQFSEAVPLSGQHDHHRQLVTSIGEREDLDVGVFGIGKLLRLLHGRDGTGESFRHRHTNSTGSANVSR